jgi:hypothetical protein
MRLTAYSTSSCEHRGEGLASRGGVEPGGGGGGRRARLERANVQLAAVGSHRMVKCWAAWGVWGGGSRAGLTECHDRKKIKNHSSCVSITAVAAAVLVVMFVLQVC